MFEAITVNYEFLFFLCENYSDKANSKVVFLLWDAIFAIKVALKKYEDEKKYKVVQF